jgi:hypothetical protein
VSIRIAEIFNLPIVVAIFSTACVSTARYQSWSAGQIGCPPKEITIIRREMYGMASYWLAKCRGKRFFCSLSGTARTLSCREEIQQSSGRPQVAADANPVPIAKENAEVSP